MSIRNPETITRLTDRLQGNLVNLKLIVKSQQPVEDYIKKIESPNFLAALFHKILSDWTKDVN